MKSNIQELLTKNTEIYSMKALEAIDMFAPGVFRKGEKFKYTEGASFIDKVMVSILFTGTVYGEYILVFDKKSAVFLCNKIGLDKIDDQNEEFLEKLGEVLNLIVGQSVSELNASFEKLTITAPKVVLGNTVSGIIEFIV